VQLLTRIEKLSAVDYFMFVDLEEIWNSDKALSSEPEWKVQSRKEFARLVSPLEVNRVTLEGLHFTASAHIPSPERAVAFQIEYFPAKKPPPGGPMARLEWKPRSPHNNKGIGPKELRHIMQRGTHFHSFEMNWLHDPLQVRKGMLPISVPVEHEMETFQETLAFVEELFRINGVSKLPPPPWTQSLL
jgi:hypothetical protein